ncbi:MAG TPA: hypothetical protein VD813_07050 [Pseudonocardia sp.]|nr:hypothetical protein [Pseudonocardia sp.]
MTLLVLAAPMLMLLLMLAMERFEAVLLPPDRAGDAPAPDVPQSDRAPATAAGGRDDPRGPRVSLIS